jgi:hypothetical protein
MSTQNNKYIDLVKWLLITVAIIVFIIYFHKTTTQILGHLEKTNQFIEHQVSKRDTVWKEYHYSQTLKLQPVSMDGTVTPQFLIENNIPIDTNDFKFNHLPHNIYVDTVRKDSSYVIIKDKVAGWRTNADVQFFLKYPEITNTVTKQKFRLYTYLRLGSDFKNKPYLTSAAPGAGFVSKKGFVVGYDYNFMNKSHNVTIGKVISFKK